MKKLIVVILVIAMALAIVACGGKTDEPQGQAGTAPEASQSAGTSPGSSSGSSPGTSQAAPPEVPMPEAAGGVQMSTFNGPTGSVTRYITEAPGKSTKADPTTLYLGQMIPVENGNPGFGSDSAFYEAVFDPFITFDYDTGEYVGYVIKDWKLADDCLSMEITIHDNILFHDGTKATMEDIIYSLYRLSRADLSRQSDKTIFGNIDFDNCEITSDYSGKLVFFRPAITVVSGFTKAWIFSKNHIETLGEDDAWWDSTMGTGPYAVESIIQGDRYNLVRNNNYWGDVKGSFEKVVIRYYAEASTMYIDYETEVLDIIVNPLAVDASRVINGDVDNTICDIYPMLYLAVVRFNAFMNPELMDINVRKAICLSIDEVMVNKIVFDFLGSPTTALAPDGVGNLFVGAMKQDLDAAKQALADAGYGPGELKLSLGTNTNNVNLNIAEALQAQIAESGIVVDIITAEPSVNLNNLRNEGPDIYDFAQGFLIYTALEPAAMLNAVSGAVGANSFNAIIDDHVDELAVRASLATTVKEKNDLITELQQYLLENYWIRPLLNQRVAIVYRDYITGIRVIAPRMPNINAVALVG